MIGAVLHLALATLVATLPPADGVADSTLLHWLRAHATPIPVTDSSSDVADLRALAPLIGRAQLIALGEPTHGAHEPLAFRNRLFRWLVAEQGVTAIALETGLPESRHVADFVAGGPTAPPLTEAERVVRENFTWGFGTFAENVALVRWMRTYNDDPSHRTKLRFYGIDLSLGGREGSTPTPAAIEAVLAFLARVDSGEARAMQARLAPFLPRLPDGGPTFSPAAHDSLTAAIETLVALLDGRRARYARRAWAEDYAWARRAAEVARLGDRVFRVEPAPSADGGIPRSAWRAMEARDSAMAENLRWVMSREGRRGRVLVYAHDMHVKNAPTAGGPFGTLERAPTVLGQYLRQAFADSVVVIGTSAGAATTGAPGGDGVESTLARVGLPQFALDLRAGRRVPGVAEWLAERRTFSVNGGTPLVLSPGIAFDVLVYFNTLTPSRGPAG